MVDSCPVFQYSWNFIWAPMVELADTPDLGSGGRPWGFKSLLAHQKSGDFLKSLRFFIQIPEVPIYCYNHFTVCSF